MRMVWPQPVNDSSSNRLPASLQADTSTVSQVSQPSDPLGVLTRVAVITALGVAVPNSEDATVRPMSLAELVETGLLQIDMIPTRFDGPDAVNSVASAFVQFNLYHNDQPYDALLLLGCGAVEPDVGMLHTVLAPCIAKLDIPVLTAVGSDDANTILGDVADRVFASPAALIAFVATRLVRVPIPATETIDRIRSLASFMLNELAVESRILLDASLRPALQQHLTTHTDMLAQWCQRVAKVKLQLEQRLARESAALENLRTYVDQQLAQHAERQRSRSQHALTRLRLVSVLAYVSFVAMLWAITTPQLLVFLSGCALVLLSALYTALSERILVDIEAIPVRASIVRARLKHRSASHGAAVEGPYEVAASALVHVPESTRTSGPSDSPDSPDSLESSALSASTAYALSQPLSGVLMTNQPNEHVTRAYRDAADENLLLGTILQRLEQSDHLSLDELDAIILQADAAYKTRLARLEHTRAMIAGLGTAEVTA